MFSERTLFAQGHLADRKSNLQLMTNVRSSTQALVDIFFFFASDIGKHNFIKPADNRKREEELICWRRSNKGSKVCWQIRVMRKK